MADTKTMKTGEEEGVDEAEERERMRKIRQKLAKKKWGFSSDSEESSSSEEDDDEEGEHTDKHEEHNGQQPVASGRGAEKGEEKSIEYLLKKYYSKEAQTDDLVKVGDKWMKRKSLEEQEEEKKALMQSQQEQDKKNMSIKKLQDLSAMTNLKIEIGKTKKGEKEGKKAKKEKEKEEKKKIKSPPLSPRGLLSFSKEKRKKVQEASNPASNSPPSPSLAKRALSAHENRRRAGTAINARANTVEFESSPKAVDDEGVPVGKRPSSAEYLTLDLEDVEKDREKNERRRSVGFGSMSCDQDRVLRGEIDAGAKKQHRWSANLDENGSNNNGTTPVAGGSRREEPRRKKRLSVKLPVNMEFTISSKKSHNSNSSEGSSGVGGSGGTTTTTTAATLSSSGGVATQQQTPPVPPPPPKVVPVPESDMGGRTLARELSAVYCYSDRRDWDFREEMLEREKERKKLLELKKDIKNSEQEYQRRKKDSVKDENKKAKWGLLFSLPQDMRQLKHLGGSGVVVDNGGAGDEEDDSSEGEENNMTKEQLSQRVRLLNIRLERTISQLLLEDPAEGEKLLAQKQQEEEKRKKQLEGVDTDEEKEV